MSRTGEQEVATTTTTGRSPIDRKISRVVGSPDRVIAIDRDISRVVEGFRSPDRVIAIGIILATRAVIRRGELVVEIVHINAVKVECKLYIG